MFQKNILEGKRILVTGGGSGLGKEMTKAFASHGATVYISGRRAEKLEETAREIESMIASEGGDGQPRVIPKPLDIRGAADVDECIEEIFADGPLDALINNAAGNFISRTKDLSPRGFDAIANIVFRGTFYVTHAVGKRWIELGHPGSVVSILTTWVWTGSPFVVPSTMSKTAIHAMTKALAVEWGPHKIRLNAIAPGPFPTEGAWARLRIDNRGEDTDYNSANPMGRTGEMEELQNLAMFLIADGCDYLTGQTIAIDGGAYLQNNGSFGQLASWSDADWENAREAIRAADSEDKAKRTT